MARQSTELGARLRELRVGRGLTQEELALSLGVAQSDVARWESGAREPRVDTLRRLAAALGYSQIAIVFKEAAH